MITCAQCRKECKDNTEFSGLNTEAGVLAVHRWCIAELSEWIRDRKPYEKLDFPPECWLRGEDLQNTWRSTNRA